MATSPKILKLGIIASVVLSAAPVSSWAGWLGFRNDVKESIIVQSSPVLKGGQVGLARPKTMVSDEVAWESVLQPGNRLIRIYDKNKKLIYIKTVPVMGDLFFSIQLEPKTNNILLVPMKAPVQPPGQK